MQSEDDDDLYSVEAFCAFEFTGSDPADLPLKAGQMVTVTAKVDNEWLYGECGGRKGLFPALFVSVGEGECDMLYLENSHLCLWFQGLNYLGFACPAHLGPAKFD